MNIKKWIASLLIVCMVSWILPSYDVVKAAMNEQDEVDEIIEEIEAELGIEIPEELEITVTEESRKSIVLDMYLDTEDLDVNVEIEFDVEAEEFMVSGEETDEHGNVVHYEYDIIIHEADEDVFVATFIDVETGEIIEIDSTELQASILPAIVLGIIIRVGIKYAIKKFSKKFFSNAMKDKRWPGSKGWEKKQRTIKTSKGNINIHFNYNTRTKKYDDFKFK